MMTTEEIQNAYNNLSARDRELVDMQAAKLEAGVKKLWEERRSNPDIPANFGRAQALELLARLGIWMINGDSNEHV